MTLQLLFIYRFLAANLALVRSFTGLSSYVGLGVRCVVVVVDFWYVAERHVTDLTLDGTRGPNLRA